MEQDIVNNLKSRVQKLEEELLRVVSIKLWKTTCIVLLWSWHLVVMVFFILCVEWECAASPVVMYMYNIVPCSLDSGETYPLDF